MPFDLSEGGEGGGGGGQRQNAKLCINIGGADMMNGCLGWTLLGGRPRSSNVPTGFGAGSSSLSAWSRHHLDNLLKINRNKQAPNNNFNNHTIGPASSSEEAEAVTAVDDASDRNDITQGEVVLGIAQGLNALSVAEREEVYADIHGIGREEVDEEDSDVMRRHLKALNVYIQEYLMVERGTTTKNDSSSSLGTSLAIQQAMNQSPNYVLDPNFQIMFLRAESYNPTEAGNRMIRFFEEKKQLFGMENLTKEITLEEGLDEEDVAFLKCGVFQTVPLKDQSGRLIFMILPKLKPPEGVPDKRLMRVGFYMFMNCAKDDIDAQRRGIVEIFYKVGDTNKSDFNTAKKMQKLRGALPLKTAAGHTCSDDPTVKFLLNVTRPFISLHRLTRMRIHCGNHMETQFELLTFGIPLAALPVNTIGGYSNQFHQIWVDWRRQVEKQTQTNARQTSSSSSALPSSAFMLGSSSTLPSTADSLSKPTDRDVLLGRGKSIDQHVGNIEFRKFIQQPKILQQYEDSPKFLKFQVAEPIQKILQADLNVRFFKLDPDGNGWKLADDASIKSKILRTCRRLIALKHEGKDCCKI